MKREKKTNTNNLLFIRIPPLVYTLQTSFERGTTGAIETERREKQYGTQSFLKV